MAARKIRKMTREQLLAAEIYGYSFANYEAHLGIGNVRFDRLMPQDARLLERAAAGKWATARLAKELKEPEEIALDLLDRYRRAAAIVDAEDPAEAFRNGVRFSIRNAVEEGLSTDAAVEALVVQICYRAADLAYLLEVREENLSRYSEHLRREPDDEDD